MFLTKWASDSNFTKTKTQKTNCELTWKLKLSISYSNNCIKPLTKEHKLNKKDYTKKKDPNG